MPPILPGQQDDTPRRGFRWLGLHHFPGVLPRNPPFGTECFDYMVLFYAREHEPSVASVFDRCTKVIVLGLIKHDEPIVEVPALSNEKASVLPVERLRERLKLGGGLGTTTIFSPHPPRPFGHASHPPEYAHHSTPVNPGAVWAGGLYPVDDARETGRKCVACRSTHFAFPGRTASRPRPSNGNSRTAIRS